MAICVWDYRQEYESEREEILSAVDGVFRSGTLIFGENLQRFELEFAQYCQSPFGVGVGNCTDALALALRGIGIEPGDEVITVANTAIPTISAIVQTGAVPIFIDVREEDYLIDVAQLRNAITPKTRFILPVHLFGQCVDMDAILGMASQRGLKVIEDCAQAHGSVYKGRKAGSLADASCFSFYPTKTLGAYGDAGMIVTSDAALHERLRALRFYGIVDYGKPTVDRRYYAEMHGYNSRLDEVQAAILRLKLRRLENYIEKRRAIAELYQEELQKTSLVLPRENPSNKHTYYAYVVRHPQRDRIVGALKDRGIMVNISYPYPVHLMNGYRYLGYAEGSLPVTERLSREIVSLPMYPSLSLQDQRCVVDVLKRVS